MKKFIVLAVLIVLGLTILSAGTGYALASVRPFRPGDLPFPVQNLAEQINAYLISDATGRALYYLELADQRTEDLTALSGGKKTLLALKHLSMSLDHAIQAVVDAPEGDLGMLSANFADLLARMEMSVTMLGELPEEQAALYSALITKINALQEMLGVALGNQFALSQVDGDVVMLPLVGNSGISGAPIPGIDPRAVAFPPGSLAALHSFYPLNGQHAVIECTDCHTNGQYSGTPTICEDCHSPDKPLNHFVGECAACHSPVSWTDVRFDHRLAGSNDCTSCHSKDKPRNHFDGQCSACHDTTNWAGASFNHAAVGAKDCLSCHQKDKPANHFDGQCSSCHNTSNWKDATFNHQAMGATDCLSCHSKDKPKDHFEGQCSACHNTSSWAGGKFDHGAAGVTNCLSCHSDDKPSNHFDGQCSACHNTSDWRDAQFDHGAAGATNCVSCHTRPANHFDGQCSACHNTSNWGDARFDHDAAGATNCVSCHTRPANHYDGQCSACHNTSSWGGAQFDHDAAGATDCISCHINDRPDEHSQEQCSACHNTSNWGDAEGG